MLVITLKRTWTKQRTVGLAGLIGASRKLMTSRQRLRIREPTLQSKNDRAGCRRTYFSTYYHVPQSLKIGRSGSLPLSNHHQNWTAGYYRCKTFKYVFISAKHALNVVPGQNSNSRPILSRRVTSGHKLHVSRNLNSRAVPCHAHS